MQNYLQDPTKCYYPYAIEKHLKKANEEELKLISRDTEQAKELILLFCSNLVSTQFEYFKGNGHKIKSLHSDILMEQLSKNYVAVKKYLINNNLIGTDNHFEVGEHSISYWFKEEVLKSKVKEYTLTNDTIIKRRESINNKFEVDLKNNPIARISVEKVFPNLILPTESQVKTLLEKEARSGYVTKKGKRLKILGNKKRQTSGEGSDIIYTEDLLKIYRYLTKDGVKLYSTGNQSCPRPISSTTLIPAIIRDQITLNGKELFELDFTCLHPNIANFLYGGNANMITHDDMADFLKVDEKVAKKLNLSYLNYEEKFFLNSRASKFYKTEHPDLFNNLLRIKQKDPKIITHQMFNKEVELMTRIFLELDRHEILPMYVYDAVYVIEDDVAKAKQIMNDTAYSMGIISTV